MESTTYVCPECRTTKRGRIVVGLKGKNRCPNCRELMFKLFPSTRIPARDDNNGWMEIRREIKRIESRSFANRKHLIEWEAQMVRRKRENLDNRLHEARSDQEIKYFRWKQNRVSAFEG